MPQCVQSICVYSVDIQCFATIKNALNVTSFSCMKRYMFIHILHSLCCDSTKQHHSIPYRHSPAPFTICCDISISHASTKACMAVTAINAWTGPLLGISKLNKSVQTQGYREQWSTSMRHRGQLIIQHM